MIILKNNAQSITSLPVDASQATITVSIGDGIKFPKTDLGDTYFLALSDNAGNLEFVYVTNRSGDEFSVERGKEGTAAQDWAIGTRIQLRMTAETWREMSSNSWNRLAEENGDHVTPIRISDTVFSVAGDRTKDFQQSRSFRLYSSGGVFFYGFVADATFSAGRTAVTVDSTGVMPANIYAVDLGLNIFIEPKAGNAAPVSHLADENAHKAKFEALETRINEFEAEVRKNTYVTL